MEPISKVIIFGATGNTGLCCVTAALDLGFDVTAFVQDVNKLPQELTGRVSAFNGDVRNIEDLEKAIPEHDAVIIALGTRNDLSATTLLSTGTKNIIEVMKKYGIKRISACISAFLFWERTNVPERFHPITEDHERMLNVIKSSNLEWVAVLPPHIADSPGKRDFIIEHDKAPGRTISKYDLGYFLVHCLTNDDHLRQCCGLCDKPE